MTEEPPPQTGQALAGVRDPATAAEQALAEREGTPGEISTGAVVVEAGKVVEVGDGVGQGTTDEQGDA